jgi:hypothetical protein
MLSQKDEELDKLKGRATSTNGLLGETTQIMMQSTSRT